MQKSRITKTEQSYGRVLNVYGFVVTAENLPAAFLYEIVHLKYINIQFIFNQQQSNRLKQVGTSKREKFLNQIMGMYLSIALIIPVRNFIIFKDLLAGISTGDPVSRTYLPLSVSLGPGILSETVDGLQRPLNAIANITRDLFLPKETLIPPIDKKKLWEFVPNRKIKEEDILNGGDMIGECFENDLFQDHKILLPPGSKGRIKYKAPHGFYECDETIMEVEFNSIIYQYSMNHKWPVRKPRPVLEKLQSDEPFITGFRFLDGIYPASRGDTVLIHNDGGGKSIFWQSMAKLPHTDIAVYVETGERESEVTTMNNALSELVIKHKDRNYSAIMKTCLIANNCSFPPYIRESSIFTGITIAEYFRDMGNDIVLMIDSMSRWGESFQEVSEIIGKHQFEVDYSNKITSVLDQFYARAGTFSCCGQPQREGSITIFNSIQGPINKQNDILQDIIIKNSQCKWAFDKRIAARRIFPSIDWKMCSSKCLPRLKTYFENLTEKYSYIRKKIVEIIDQEPKHLLKKELNNKESIEQELESNFFNLVIECYLCQNFFTEYDYHCPIYKTTQMMSSIVKIYDKVKEVMAKSSRCSNWLDSYYSLKSPIERLHRLKFMVRNIVLRLQINFIHILHGWQLFYDRALIRLIGN